MPKFVVEAEQARFCLTGLESPKTVFFRNEADGFLEYILFLLKIIDCRSSVELLQTMF